MCGKSIAVIYSQLLYDGANSNLVGAVSNGEANAEFMIAANHQTFCGQL